MVGVAVASDDSLLAVDADSGRTQVATSGSADVLVSTLNGDIKVGDQIAVSPFNGVGIKAVPGSHIIGQAQVGFNGGQGAITQTVTDRDGKEKEIKVGLVTVNISVGTDTTSGGGEDLNALQRAAQSLTGHTVSTTRVIIALVVAVVTLMILITLIYGSIYSSIISIGRNPLAKYAVFRTLGSVLAVASLVAVLAGTMIFLLLR